MWLHKIQLRTCMTTHGRLQQLKSIARMIGEDQTETIYNCGRSENVCFKLEVLSNQCFGGQVNVISFLCSRH
jgi:hypothetical protein